MKRTEVQPGQSRWKKTGGGSFHAKIGGKTRIIKPGEIFIAREDEIPESFRDTVKPLGTVVQATSTETKKVEEVVEEVVKVTASPTPSALEYEVRARSGGGYFDVVDKNGKVQNEKALRKDAAAALLESLTE